jgi:hypothetical protein
MHSVAGRETMNRTDVTSETRELANRLVAFEAAFTSITKGDEHATCRVFEKLRRPLVILTGTAGFSSLLLRALTLAKREAPALSVVEIKANGSMEGLESAATEATSVLVAYLLSLLITFIGETLTMRLLHDVWPNLPSPALTPLEKETK